VVKLFKLGSWKTAPTLSNFKLLEGRTYPIRVIPPQIHLILSFLPGGATSQERELEQGIKKVEHLSDSQKDVSKSILKY
jgi:hypothetical protein